MKNKIYLAALTAATAAMLAACGGGDGDTVSGPGGAEPIEKYMGTFVSVCRAEDPSITTSAGLPLRSQETWSAPTKVSATKASFVLTLRTFTSSDCSGTAFSELSQNAGGNTFFQVDGTATIDGKAVDKMTIGEGVWFPGIAANVITVNGVSYSGPKFSRQAPLIEKEVLSLVGNALSEGDRSKPLDAQGYPTALSSTPSATKQ